MNRSLFAFLVFLCWNPGFSQDTKTWTFSLYTGSASSVNGYCPSSDIVLKSEGYSASLPGSSLKAYNSNGGYLNGPEWWFDPSNIPIGFEAEHTERGLLLGLFSLHLKMETQPDVSGYKYRLAWGRSEEVFYVGWKKAMNKTFSYAFLGGPSVIFTKPIIEIEGLDNATGKERYFFGSSDKVKYGGYGLVGMARIEASNKWLGFGLHAGFSGARVSTYASLSNGGPSIGRFVHYTFTPYWGFALYLKSGWRG